MPIVPGSNLFPIIDTSYIIRYLFIPGNQLYFIAIIIKYLPVFTYRVSIIMCYANEGMVTRSTHG